MLALPHMLQTCLNSYILMHIFDLSTQHNVEEGDLYGDIKLDTSQVIFSFLFLSFFFFLFQFFLSPTISSITHSLNHQCLSHFEQPMPAQHSYSTVKVSKATQFLEKKVGYDVEISHFVIYLYISNPSSFMSFPISIPPLIPLHPTL